MTRSTAAFRFLPLFQVNPHPPLHHPNIRPPLPPCLRKPPTRLLAPKIPRPSHRPRSRHGVRRRSHPHACTPPARRSTSLTDIAAPAGNTDTAAASKTAKASDTAVATSIISEPTDTDVPLPKPFDGGLGTNYTQPSCPMFLKAMINNDTFTSCLPFSLFLQNSMSFFSASRTLPSITRTLNASCAIFYPSCSSLISQYALTLRSPSACAQDYTRQNPIIREAYAGLIAYDVLYQAACLKNVPVPGVPTSSDDNYCYANAVTNKSNPSDNYIYYLPLGIPLPPAALPTCNGCLKNTMAIFASAAANKSQPLNLDYVDAATVVNLDCGPGFVNGTIPSVGSSSSGSGSTSAAAGRVSGGWWMVVVVAVVVVGAAQSGLFL